MINTQNPNYKDYVKLKVERNQFIRLLDFELTDIQVGSVEGLLPVQEKHEQQNGFVHGGVIGTLCDMACGYAAYSLVAEGVQVFTTEIKVSYLRPGIGEQMRVKGWVVKPGSMFHFCESEVYAVHNGAEKLIAKASSTMAVVDRKVNDKYGD